MVLLRCATLPDSYDNREYSSAEFEDYEREPLAATGADYAAYWYATGSYCGAGHIIARKVSRWYHHDCGHCSCYGPTEGIDFSGPGFASVEELLDNCSEDLRDQLRPLVGVLP